MDQEIAQWIAVFKEKHMFKPPEFYCIHTFSRWLDVYSADVGSTKNPVQSEWFKDLVHSGDLSQLDTLQTMFDTAHDNATK